MSSLPIEKVVWLEPGRGIRATGMIPYSLEFFQDHFPAFPILPGVLSLEILKKTAESYFQKVQDAISEIRCFLKQIQQVKFSHYLKPGEKWESHLELLAQEGGQTHWNARLYHNGKTAVSARMALNVIRGFEDLVTS